MDMSLIMEGINTIVPGKMTYPKFSRKISTPPKEKYLDKNNGSFQGIRACVIFFYNEKNDENVGSGSGSGSGSSSGWHVGGWMKQSLGDALVENAILAGRLAKSKDDDDGNNNNNNNYLEIVANDGGVRVAETQVPLSLEEYFESREKDGVQSSELLTNWKDIDEKDPQFSPLFYIQVTNFQCGGYSVGISYFLLLTDPFCMANFLTRWAEIHRSISYDCEIPKTPLFYAPNYGNRRSWPHRPPTTATTNPSGRNSETALFNISIEENITTTTQGSDICKHLVLLCIKEAEDKFGLEMGLEFVLITKKPNGDNKVEKVPKKGSFGISKNLKFEINALSWDVLGINKIAFQRDNLPIEVSHWVQALEGVVLAVISDPLEGKYGMKVYVTFPI